MKLVVTMFSTCWDKVLVNEDFVKMIRTVCCDEYLDIPSSTAEKNIMRYGRICQEADKCKSGQVRSL